MPTKRSIETVRRTVEPARGEQASGTVVSLRSFGLRAEDTHLRFHAGAEIEVARSDLNPRVGTLVNVEAATDSNVPPGISAQLAIANLVIKSKSKFVEF